MHLDDDPERLRKRAYQLHDVARTVSDQKDAEVLIDLAGKLLAKATALEREKK